MQHQGICSGIDLSGPKTQNVYLRASIPRRTPSPPERRAHPADLAPPWSTSLAARTVACRAGAAAALPGPGRLLHDRRALPLDLACAALQRGAGPRRLGRDRPDRPPRRHDHAAGRAGPPDRPADRRARSRRGWCGRGIPGDAAHAACGSQRAGGGGGLPCAAPAAAPACGAAGRAALGHLALPDRPGPPAAPRRATDLVYDAERAAAAGRDHQPTTDHRPPTTDRSPRR